MNIKNDDDYTHFGYKNVTSKEKTLLVKEVFSSVASKYDLMNNVMSFGIHNIWKRQFINHVEDFSGKLLDLASGTGDIARLYYEKAKAKDIKPKIIMSDYNFAMLNEGCKKNINEAILDIDLVLANAENLPFASGTFDYVTIAFGIRNVTDIPKALSEIYRVLKTGGKFICLEFSKVETPVIKEFYSLYSKYIIPKAGEIIAHDKQAYQYLIESIEKFYTQEEFKQRIIDAGFIRSGYQNLNLGVVAIHWGWKI